MPGLFSGERHHAAPQVRLLPNRPCQGGGFGCSPAGGAAGGRARASRVDEDVSSRPRRWTPSAVLGARLGVATDFECILTGLEKCRAWCIASGRLCAAEWCVIWRILDDCGWRAVKIRDLHSEFSGITVVKVKSHAAASQIHEGVVTTPALNAGNAWADKLAKEGAARH